MLAKNPIDRYQNPTQVLTALSVMETGTIGEMLLAKRVELVLRARDPDVFADRGKFRATVILPSDAAVPAPAASQYRQRRRRHRPR